MASYRWALAVPLVAGALALCGCGGADPVPEHPKGVLEGRVTLDGNPVMLGSVLALGMDGSTGRGDILEDGSYRIEKCPTGPLRLGIDLSGAVPAEYTREAPRGVGPDGRALPPETPGEDLPPEIRKAYLSVRDIPPHYFAPERSMIHTLVPPTGEAVTFNIRLSSKAVGPEGGEEPPPP